MVGLERGGGRRRDEVGQGGNWVGTEWRQDGVVWGWSGENGVRTSCRKHAFINYGEFISEIMSPAASMICNFISNNKHNLRNTFQSKVE